MHTCHYRNELVGAVHGCTKCRLKSNHEIAGVSPYHSSRSLPPDHPLVLRLLVLVLPLPLLLLRRRRRRSLATALYSCPLLYLSSAPTFLFPCSLPWEFKCPWLRHTRPCRPANGKGRYVPGTQATPSPLSLISQHQFESSQLKFERKWDFWQGNYPILRGVRQTDRQTDRQTRSHGARKGILDCCFNPNYGSTDANYGVWDSAPVGTLPKVVEISFYNVGQQLREKSWWKVAGVGVRTGS